MEYNECSFSILWNSHSIKLARVYLAVPYIALVTAHSD